MSSNAFFRFMDVEVQSLKQIPCLYFLGVLLLQREYFLFYYTCMSVLSKPLCYLIKKKSRCYLRAPNVLCFRTSSKKIWSLPLTLTPFIPFSLPSMGKINSNNIFSFLYEPHRDPAHATSDLWKGIRSKVPRPIFNLTNPLLIHAGDA